MGVGLAFTEAGIHGVLTASGSVAGAAYLVAIGPGPQATGMVTAVVSVPVVFPNGICPLLAGAGWPGVPPQLSHWHSPLGLPVRYGPIADTLSVGGILLAVIAVAGLVVRWRHGGLLVRQLLATFPEVAIVGMADASAAEITAALRIVAAGGAVFAAGVASRLLAERPRGHPSPPG